MSEFGKGFVYNLVLIAKHWGEYHSNRDMWKKIGKSDEETESWAVRLWASAAGDHIQELEVPERWRDQEIGQKVQEAVRLLNDCRFKGNVSGAFSQVHELVLEAAILIDKELGVDVEKAEWS